MTTWRTDDGRVLLIKWMDSAHLVNAANMMLRQMGMGPAVFMRIPETSLRGANASVLLALRKEIRQRYLYNVEMRDAFDKPKRETLTQLCMLHALIDTGWYQRFGVRETFMADRDKFIDDLINDTAPLPDQAAVVTQFIANRMDR